MNGLTEACKRLDVTDNTLTPLDTAKLVARLKYPEPRILSAQRHEQIDGRARYLLRLCVQHQRGKTYLGLNMENTDGAIQRPDTT
jgi:hypothetical protein